MERLPDPVIRGGAKALFFKQFRPFQEASKDPKGSQERLLREIVAYNQGPSSAARTGTPR